MAFFQQGVFLVIFAVLLKPHDGVPLQRSGQNQRLFDPVAVKIERNIDNPGTPARQGQVKRVSSSFVFINDTEIAKGLDYLKKKYPGVDWSLVTPLPTVSSGKREFNGENSSEQSKRTSSFAFINDTDIAKGLDFLKKKYPGVDWSLVTPLPTLSSGKRDFDSAKKSLKNSNRTSSFVFINDTEIEKGLDYLKKKYPAVDWSLVTPLPTVSPGKRDFQSEMEESRLIERKKDFGKQLDQFKRDMKNLHSSIAGRNDIPKYGSEAIKQDQRKVVFSTPEEEIKYLRERR